MTDVVDDIIGGKMVHNKAFCDALNDKKTASKFEDYCFKHKAFVLCYHDKAMCIPSDHPPTAKRIWTMLMSIDYNHNYNDNAYWQPQEGGYDDALSSFDFNTQILCTGTDAFIEYLKTKLHYYHNLYIYPCTINKGLYNNKQEIEDDVKVQKKAIVDILETAYSGKTQNYDAGMPAKNRILFEGESYGNLYVNLLAKELLNRTDLLCHITNNNVGPSWPPKSQTPQDLYNALNEVNDVKKANLKEIRLEHYGSAILYKMFHTEGSTCDYFNLLKQDPYFREKVTIGLQNNPSKEDDLNDDNYLKKEYEEKKKILDDKIALQKKQLADKKKYEEAKKEYKKKKQQKQQLKKQQEEQEELLETQNKKSKLGNNDDKSFSNFEFNSSTGNGGTTSPPFSSSFSSNDKNSIGGNYKEQKSRNDKKISIHNIKKSSGKKKSGRDDKDDDQNASSWYTPRKTNDEQKPKLNTAVLVLLAIFTLIIGAIIYYNHYKKRLEEYNRKINNDTNNNLTTIGLEGNSLSL